MSSPRSEHGESIEECLKHRQVVVEGEELPFGSKELVIVVAVGLWWWKAVEFKWFQNEKMRQTQLMSRSMFRASEYLKSDVRIRLHALCALGRRHEQIW